MGNELRVGHPRGPRSEGKSECFPAKSLAHQRFVRRVQENGPERGPAAKTGWRLARRSGPRAAGQRTAYADVLIVLTHGQEGDARALAESELEITRARITNQYFANERGLGSVILELADARLPIRFRFNKLVAQGLATRQCKEAKDTG